MLFASGDPTNVALALLFSGILLFCLWLTWYAYFLWKIHPEGSISHRIAVYFQRFRERMLIGMVLGLVIGFAFGVFVGMFVGHWFWPVELGG